MKKSQRLLALLAALCTALTACGGKNAALPDTYVAGSDWQYMQQNGGDFFTPIQKTEEGCYISQNGFVYYLDEGTDTLLPLCNKADCLHDGETDMERREACNAYISWAGDAGINYCNGWLYSIDLYDGILYRLAPDGTRKEKLYQWEATQHIQQWLVHRDVLYYVEQLYYLEDGRLAERYSFYRMPLTDGIPQPEPVYEPPEGVTPIGFYHPAAYGSYVYVLMMGTTMEGPLDPNKVYEEDEIYDRMIAYHTVSGEVTELTVPDMEPGDDISSVTFWQDRVLLQLWHHEKGGKSDWERPATVYSAKLDGSDLQVLMEDVPQGYLLLSDGQYLYLTNHHMVTYSNEGEVCYWVYDKDLNEVDSFTLPFQLYYYMAPGDPETAYQIYTEYADEEDFTDGTGEREPWGVLRWDKSGIGSYHGGTFDYTEIPCDTP